MSTRQLPRLILIMLTISLAGCVTHYQPRYGYDGVYYDRPVVQYRAVHADPLLYPYWSLDYFYFSRYYHPYSILIDIHDPWYYPYPGWYYGYTIPARSRLSVSYGSAWYPWYRFGAHYHDYRPWRPHQVVYPRYPQSGWVHQPRVRQIDERLREMERRQRAPSAALRQPGAPALGADRISTRRTGVSSRPSQQPERRSDPRLRPTLQREPGRIPRRETPARRSDSTPIRREPTPAGRSRSFERSRSPGQRELAPPPQRDNSLPSRIPRAGASERPSAPARQAPPPRQALPPARTVPASPPPSQPAPPPPRQSSPPPRRSESQRSAPRRERQRER